MMNWSTEIAGKGRKRGTRNDERGMMNSEPFSLLIHHSSFIIPHLLWGFGYAGGHGRSGKSDRGRGRSPRRGYLEVPFVIPAARPGRTVAVESKSLTV